MTGGKGTAKRAASVDNPLLRAACPTCHAPPGRWCTHLLVERATVLHSARVTAAEEAGYVARR